MISRFLLHRTVLVMGVFLQTNACTPNNDGKNHQPIGGTTGYGDVMYPEPEFDAGSGGSGNAASSSGNGQASSEFGAPPPPTKDYDLDAETATSKTTGRMWLRATLDTRFTGGSCIDRCGDLVAAGKDDWRAPTLDELKGILVLRDHCPLIDEDAFPLTLCSWYTSSDTPTGSGDDFLMLSFLSGDVKTRSEASPAEAGFPCRCVR